MSAQNENQDRDFIPRFYRLASVSVLWNMMIPFSWGDLGKHLV